VEFITDALLDATINARLHESMQRLID